MDGGVGGYLKGLRASRQISQRQLAQHAAVAQRTLSYWETNAHQPCLAELEAVLKALDASDRERNRALTLLDAPRGRAIARQAAAERAAHTDLGPMPSGGDLLRAMRHRRRLYLEQAAEGLGVTAATLSRWEQGKILPASEKLNALLTLLHATPQERFALTEGALFLTPPLHETAGSLEALETACQPFLWPNIFVESTRRLRHKDLTYLSLAAQAWRQAREPRARRLLSEIYANYANHLASGSRFAEAQRYAYYALDLLPDKSALENFHARAAIIAAKASVYRGARPAPKRGLEMLHLWLPLAFWPDYKAWILSDIAKYLALDDALDSAIGLTEQSCEVARRGASSQELFMRQCDLAKLLLRADRAAAALPLTQITTWEDEPLQRAEMELVRVETLLRLGDRGEASDWLQHAYEEIEACNLEPLREKADTLARQF